MSISQEFHEGRNVRMFDGVEAAKDQLEVSMLTAENWTLSFDRLSHRRSTHLLLFAVRESISLTVAQNATHVPEGSLVVLDRGRLPRTEVEVTGVGLAITVPSQALGPHAATLNAVIGRPVDTMNSGAASLVGHVLRGLAEQCSARPTSMVDAVAQHLIGLVGLTCAENISFATRGVQSHVRRAKEFIEENLSDIALTPDLIAMNVHVSTRTLHRSFGAHGLSVNGWIKQRRLEKCQVDLQDPSLVSLSVSAIGARWGLWDAAHFSRAFCDWSGWPPSRFRALHVGNGAASGTALANKWQSGTGKTSMGVPTTLASTWRDGVPTGGEK